MWAISLVLCYAAAAQAIPFYSTWDDAPWSPWPAYDYPACQNYYSLPWGYDVPRTPWRTIRQAQEAPVVRPPPNLPPDEMAMASIPSIPGKPVGLPPRTAEAFPVAPIPVFDEDFFVQPANTRGRWNIMDRVRDFLRNLVQPLLDRVMRAILTSVCAQFANNEQIQLGNAIRDAIRQVFNI